MKIYATTKAITDDQQVLDYFSQYCGQDVWIKCESRQTGDLALVRPLYFDHYGLWGVALHPYDITYINYDDQQLSRILEKLTHEIPLCGHHYTIPENVCTLTTKDICPAYPEDIDTQFDPYVGKDIWVLASYARNKYDKNYIHVLSISGGIMKYNAVFSEILAEEIEDTLESMNDVNTTPVASFIVAHPIDALTTEEMIDYIKSAERNI